MAIDQGRAISSGIGPKRSRAKLYFLEYPVEGAGSDAAVSRDHEAERQRREENKRCREQVEREVDALRTERDFLAGTVEELDSTIRGIVAIVSEQLGTVEAHPVLSDRRDVFVCIPLALGSTGRGSSSSLPKVTSW